jgi:hypothetical protein
LEKGVPQWLDGYKQEKAHPVSAVNLGAKAPKRREKRFRPLSIQSSLWLLSENGLCSLRETMLPRFEGASSTIGVIGVRIPREVS